MPSLEYLNSLKSFVPEKVVDCFVDLSTTCFHEFPINKISDPREKEDDERDVAEQELRLRELLKANEELQRKVAEVNYQINYIPCGP